MVVARSEKIGCELQLNEETLRFVADPRVKSRKTAREAEHIADQVLGGDVAELPDELALFRALQASAFRSTRKPRTREGSRKREEWRRRWKLVRDTIVEILLLQRLAIDLPLPLEPLGGRTLERGR